jgi:UDP-N-acetylmuramoyl-tripeptide--D-alanyl-D-alanine ligase
MKFVRHLVITTIQLLARLVLIRYRPLVVSVSGSVGKTSTRLATAAALTPLGYIGQPAGNYNTDIGLPLAILRARAGNRSVLAWLAVILRGVELLIFKREYPDVLVLEFGSDTPGDAAALTAIAKPTVCIVTAASAAHLEHLHDLNGVAEEEGTPVRALKSCGWAILNYDDERVWALRQRTAGSVKSFGFGEGADVRIVDWRCARHGGTLGTVVKLETAGSTVPVFVPGALGRQYAYVCAAAVATAQALNLNLVDVGTQLENFLPAPGRMRALDGLRNSLLVDDTYNSSPLACVAALETLAILKRDNLCTRTIAVLGDMLELGSTGPQLHTEVGESCDADILVTVGKLAQHIADAARVVGRVKEIRSFNTTAEASEYLVNLVQNSDAVLIKGSQGSRMEKVTKALMAYPSRSAELLVRQTDAWLVKE